MDQPTHVPQKRTQLQILGTRGVPAMHGGFETFAERLALYLVDKGWKVTVFCQEEGVGDLWEDQWQGVSRVHIPVSGSGAASTIKFDAKATLQALRRPGLLLVLGYNTGFLSVIPRLFKRQILTNMDGLEWKRSKWSRPERAWLWINERLAAWFSHHLIADHPSIADHLATIVDRDKVTTIPYGSDLVREARDAPLISKMGLKPNEYFTLIARPEPENSVLEIVRSYSSQTRGMPLVVLGNYAGESEYRAAVLRAASDEVKFVGAIYDKATLNELRSNCLAYLHGHQVGGTNPSLVEALGAGNPVIAHDNRFNRWVAGDAGLYFDSETECSQVIADLIDNDTLRRNMSEAAEKRWEHELTWDHVLQRYETLFLEWLDRA